MRSGFAALTGFAMCLLGAHFASAAELFDSGNRLGRIRVFTPESNPMGLAFLFSDDDGWSEAMDQAAGELVAKGIAVAGVPSTGILERLDADTDEKDCHYLVADIEDASERLQKQLAVASYSSPMLGGLGVGATIAYAALAQAPEATLAGAASLDSVPSLATRLPFCPGAPWTRVADGSVAYGPRPKLPGWWRVADSDPTAIPSLFAADIAGAQVVDDLDGPSPLATLISGGLMSAEAGDAVLADLPIVVLPAAQKPEALAIILSGDGGWRDLDRQIGETLAEGNIGVIGIDSLRYFWSERRPERIAADIGRIIEHYRKLWDVGSVALIGYSFGADVLPAAIAAMPADARVPIKLVALLGLSQATAFEFHVTGWLGAKADDEQPIAPDAAKLDMSLVQCVYGEEEEASLCTDKVFDKAQRIKLGGGHHFDGDYRGLAQRIQNGLERRMRATP